VREKGLLQAIENWRALRESFDRRDIAAFDLASGDQAGTDWVAIQEDRTGAAIARVASDFRSGQAEVVAQNARETAGAWDRDFDRMSVHEE
jgi:hypothetical protein